MTPPAHDSDDDLARHESDRPPAGIRCPRCGCAHSKVTVTKRGVRKTQRWRRCRACGQSFITTERVKK